MGYQIVGKPTSALGSILTGFNWDVLPKMERIRRILSAGIAAAVTDLGLLTDCPMELRIKRLLEIYPFSRISYTQKRMFRKLGRHACNHDVVSSKFGNT